MKIENENSFIQALKTGINMFVGSGFSILAQDTEGRYLPTGRTLLQELNSVFNKNNKDLSKLCTILEKNNSSAYLAYLNGRFKVKEFSKLYNNINLITLKSIYTTNIDNLIPQIIENSSNRYINDQRKNGESTDQTAINYLPLHGNVDTESNDYVFGVPSLNNVYNESPRNFSYLAHSIEKHPTLFIGYSMNDSAVIQALTSIKTMEDVQKEKWIMLINPEEDDIEYFKALNFSIIEGTLEEFLESIPNYCSASNENNKDGIKFLEDLFKKNVVPKMNSKQFVRPIEEFFRGMPPIWGDIMSNNIHKTSYYSSIKNAINSNDKNTIIIGSPLSGKTTLMRQVAFDIDGYGTKLIFDDLTETKADYIVKVLDGHKALIFIEDFTDNVDAFLKLASFPNVKLIGVDRSHNFGIVSNYFSSDKFIIINVTELSQSDLQGVFNKLPVEVKINSFNLQTEKNKKYKDDTIFEFVVRNIKGETIKQRYENTFHAMSNENEDSALFLVLCAYMHYCRVPLSMEVAISFFDSYAYDEVYSMVNQLKDVLNDFEDDDIHLIDNIDYYYPRSYYFADTILKAASHTPLLSKVINGVIERVPQIQICNYNKFKKYAFDKELFLMAFKNWHEGKDVYEKAYLFDNNNPYVLQQAALYLSAKKQYQIAFNWIDRAKTMTNNRFFSIRNSHAIIMFDANYDHSLSSECERLLDHSMEILYQCYHDDNRKTFHVLTYADQAIRYFKKIDSGKTRNYLFEAKKWLLDEAKTNKWHYGIKKKIVDIDEILTSI